MSAEERGKSSFLISRCAGIYAPDTEKMEEEARVEAERLKVEKDAKERARQAALGTKRPTKYPTEDLDLKITDKEKAKGKAVTRPALDRDLPFGGKAVFETFLMAWNFLNTFGYVPLIADLSTPHFHSLGNLSTFQRLHWTNSSIPSSITNPTYLALWSLKSIPRYYICAVG